MTSLKAPHHHVRLTAAAKADLLWWQKGLDILHGFAPFSSDVVPPSYQFATDACLLGGRAMFEGDWFYVSLEVDIPEIKSAHINVLEL